MACKSHTKEWQPGLPPLSVEGTSFVTKLGSKSLNFEVTDMNLNAIKINGSEISLGAKPDLEQYYHAISKGIENLDKKSARLPGVFIEQSKAFIWAWITVAAVAGALIVLTNTGLKMKPKDPNDNANAKQAADIINGREWNTELNRINSLLAATRNQCSRTEESQKQHCDMNKDNYQVKIKTFRTDYEAISNRSVCEVDVDSNLGIPKKVEFCEKKAATKATPAPSPAAR